jgi:hypothetical protein
MTKFSDLTLKQLEEKISHMRIVEEGLNDILRAIFMVKDEYFNKNNFESGPVSHAYLDKEQLETKNKVSFIKEFIKNTYPEDKLKKIKKCEDDCEKWVLEKEKEIALAFQKLQEREEKINREIKNHLSKESK